MMPSRLIKYSTSSGTADMISDAPFPLSGYDATAKALG